MGEDGWDGHIVKVDPLVTDFVQEFSWDGAFNLFLEGSVHIVLEEKYVALVLVVFTHVAFGESIGAWWNMEVGWWCFGINPWDGAAVGIVGSCHGDAEVSMGGSSIEGTDFGSVVVDDLFELLDFFKGRRIADTWWFSK